MANMSPVGDDNDDDGVCRRVGQMKTQASSRHKSCLQRMMGKVDQGPTNGFCYVRYFMQPFISPSGIASSAADVIGDDGTVILPLTLVQEALVSIVGPPPRIIIDARVAPSGFAGTMFRWSPLAPRRSTHWPF